MRSYIDFMICALFIFQMPLAQADFRGERGYKISNIPLEPKIVRLYVGKENTNRCSGNTIERCIEWLGEPDKVEATSGTEKQYIFYGAKQLYWGTGSDNKPIGIERREMTVIDGKVEEEFSTVQLIEHGYSWLPSKPIIAFGSRQYVCERYGKSGTSLCYGGMITPIDPLPPLQESPALLRNYSDQELGLSYRTLVTLDACSVLSQENQFIRSALLEDWNMRKPGIVDALNNTQEYPVDVSLMKNIITSGSSKQKQDANSIFCRSVLVKVKAEIIGPDDRFSSSEKTWDLFIASLDRGDVNTATTCMTLSAKQTWAPIFHDMEKQQLKNIAASFTGIKFAQPIEKFQEAIVTRSDGKSGIIVFAEIGGEWKISQL